MSTKFRTAYSFDAKGIYIGPVKAWPSPREEGEFLLPVSSTYDEPKPKKNQVSIWNGENWDYVSSKQKCYWKEDGTKVEALDHPSCHPGEEFSEEKPTVVTNREKIEELLEDNADHIQAVNDLQQRALRKVMEEISTEGERASMRAIDQLNRKISKLRGP